MVSDLEQHLSYGLQDIHKALSAAKEHERCIDPGRRATIDEVRRSRDGAERAHRGSLLAPLQGRSTSCFLPSQVRRHAWLAERRPSLMDMVGGFFTPAPAAAAAAPVAA